MQQGQSAAEIRVALEQQGFPSNAIIEELAVHQDVNASERTHRKNSRIFATRDIFDRVGYGASAPQFVNILLWLVWQTNPFILMIVGILNGVKTLLSIVWSSVLQEYNNLHQFGRQSIATAGIVYGFSFLLLAFAMLIKSIWVFGFGFLAGAIGIVAYGDLYQRFVHDTLRREHMSRFLRGMAHWGIIVTAASLLFSGYILDWYPITGVPIEVFGRQLTGYGFLFMFEITAFAFIISGYVTSFVTDNRQRKIYSFSKFFVDYFTTLKAKTKTLMKTKYVFLLTSASIISGLLQILITSYAGIAIYQLFADTYETPFLLLAIVYIIAIIASFSGPFFTQRIHRSTGLTPTLVFGTLLMAVLPLVLVYNANVVTITMALSLNVIGGAITGSAQGMLARKLLPDQVRHDYFRIQSFVSVIPYLVLIPLLAWIANTFSLSVTFLIVSIGLVFVVMPIYFLLVVQSQHQHL